VSLYFRGPPPEAHARDFDISPYGKRFLMVKESSDHAPEILVVANWFTDLRVEGEPPGIRLHKLRGDRRNYWSVTIKLPWCITFKFNNGEFSEVRVENYHRG